MTVTQRGQTLVIFTIVTAFVLLATMALVGNTQVLFVNYDRADAAALLAAQAGASVISVDQLYNSNRVVLDRMEAEKQCQNAAVNTGVEVSCDVDLPGTMITAHAVVHVHMPIPLWGSVETVSATRTAKPAYGGTVGGFKAS